MASPIRLTIKLPSGDTLDQELTQDSIIIGSGPSAALKIDSAEVSSMHAILKVKGGEVTISDLGSDAGTAVNGKSITEEVPVKPGDKIALGQVELAFELAKTEESKDVAKETKDPKKVDKSIKRSDEVATELIRDPDAKAAAEAKDAGADAKDASEPEATADANEPAKAEPKKSEPKAAAAKNPEPKKAAAKKAATGGGSLAGTDLDESLLAHPLTEDNQPTASKHALEIIAHWGNTVVDSALVSQPRDITVSGLASRHKHGDICVEVPLPGVDNQIFTIAHNRGNEASIVVPADAKVGLRDADGKITRSVQLSATDAPFPAKAYTLGFGERLAFKVGAITFTAQYVRGDAEMGKGAPMDWYFPRIFIISALVHSFFVIAAFVTPKITTSLTDDLFKNQNRFAQMILKAPEKEKKRKKLDLSGSKGGAKHKGEEGKFGKKDIPKKDALASKAGAPRVDPNKREKDRKIALNAGLLGILKGAGGTGAVSNVFGPGGLGTGINNAMGGLRGTEMGDAGGAGGLGTRGAGAGGGGNSLGIGGLGTHGHGRGTGGYGNIDLGGRGKGTTRVVPGRTIIKGSLSKQEIGRVIRRNLARFKYCYEKELNSNPNLTGKISVYFTIAPTGGVGDASVRETSMNDQNVESCVVKVMRSLKFPQPRGGGIVVVTYPFVFAST